MLLGFKDNSQEVQARDDFPLQIAATVTQLHPSVSKPLGQAGNQPRGCTLAESWATNGLMDQSAASQINQWRRILWAESLAHDGLTRQHVMSPSAWHAPPDPHKTPSTAS